MPLAPIRGQNIHFEDSGGSGPALILSHGFLMDSSMFAPQVEHLAPAYRMIRWDARGFGRTEWDGKPFTYWDSAADALALLDHLGIEEAIFGGMSQGGFISLRAALQAPHRVRALVLFSTQAGVDPPEVLAGNRQMADAWIAAGPSDPLVSAVAGLILGEQKHWEPWVSNWRAMPKESLPGPTECLLSRDDITHRLGEIAAPAIVFHGTADQAIPMERGELLAKGLSGCRRFVKVEGAAHASNLTHAEQVNPPLREFIRGLA
jgi:3-oxoadipate enol-lactonase